MYIAYTYVCVCVCLCIYTTNYSCTDVMGQNEFIFISVWWANERFFVKKPLQEDSKSWKRWRLGDCLTTHICFVILCALYFVAFLLNLFFFLLLLSLIRSLAPLMWSHSTFFYILFCQLIFCSHSNLIRFIQQSDATTILNTFCHGSITVTAFTTYLTAISFRHFYH